MSLDLFWQKSARFISDKFLRSISRGWSNYKRNKFSFKWIRQLNWISTKLKTNKKKHERAKRFECLIPARSDDDDDFGDENLSAKIKIATLIFYSRRSKPTKRACTIFWEIGEEKQQQQQPEAVGKTRHRHIPLFPLARQWRLDNDSHWLVKCHFLYRRRQGKKKTHTQ